MKIIQVIALILILMAPVAVSTYVVLNDDESQEFLMSDIQEEEETDHECLESFQLLEYLNDRNILEHQLSLASMDAQKLFKIEAQIFEDIKPETLTPPPKIS